MRAVLERDYLHEASRKRIVVLRTGLAAAVSAVVLLAYSAGTSREGVTPDEVGSMVFTAGSVSLLLMLTLFTPPLVVGSILEERLNDTLLLVLATPVGPRSFAAAKLLSRWGVSLIPAFAALPPLALAFLFGGVSGTQFTGLVVTALALSLEMAAWSAWISSASRRLATAVILSFVLPIARWVGTGFLAAWVERSYYGRVGGTGRFQAALFLATTPLGSVVQMVRATIGGAPTVRAGILLEQPWWLYLACSALTAAAAVAIAGERLRREAEPRDSLLARSKFGRRWFRGSPPAGNPLVWKEMRLLNASSSRPLFYGVMGLLIVVFALGATLVTEERTVGGLLAAMLTLVSLVAVVQGSAAVGQERTQGGYDLLRASRLTPGQIVGGKMAGVFTGMGFLAAVPFCTALLGWITGGLGTAGFLGALVAIVLFPGGWALAGMWIGVRVATPRAAVVRGMALFATLLVGLPLLALTLSLLGFDGDDVRTFLVMGSPPFTIWNFLECLRGRTWIDGADITTATVCWTTAWAVLAGLALRGLPRSMARRMSEDREEGPRFR